MEDYGATNNFLDMFINAQDLLQLLPGSRYDFRLYSMDIDEAFVRSCDQSLSYPKNVLQPNGPTYNLQTYYDMVAHHSGRLFDERPDHAAVDFLDFGDGAGFIKHRAKTLREMKLHIRKALRAGHTDPQCRFMYVHYLAACLSLTS